MIGSRVATSAGLRTNPMSAVAAVAVRNPRGAVALGGSSLAVLGVALLLLVSSVQAFLVISGQSAATNRTRLSLAAAETVAGDGGPETMIGAAGLVGSGGITAGATGGSQPTAPVTVDEVVKVYGIRVHTSIADDIRALIDAARADGVVLAGWGWRDPQTQIRLRRQHCGTTEYAIYRMPSSRCSPPTARPGSSQHERGLAIDFTYGGKSISTRRSPGFIWLNEHAAAYGLKNLASEPWHWSTTGR